MKTCHDCSVKENKYREVGCDWEECPFCHNQLLSCDCCYELLGIDANKEPVYSQGLNKEQQTKWWTILKCKGQIPYGKETRFGKIN